MAKLARSTDRRVDELRAQAAATRKIAEALEDGAEKNLALNGANTLDLMARGRAKTSEPGHVLELPPTASASDVREARRRRSVRYGADVYLPSWRDATVGLPNLLLRSALFSAVRPGAIFVEEPIGAQGKVELIMTGPQLGDYDRRLFAVCLKHYTGGRPLSSNGAQWVSTTFWQLSKELQVSYNANVHKAIRSSLNRLNAALLRIKFGRTDIPMPRLIDVAFDDGFNGKNTEDEHLKGSDQVTFRVQESMAMLFGRAEWSLLSDQALHETEGLASWLVGFYATHAGAFTLKIQDLYQYSGSVCPMYEFRRRLKAALTKLQADSVPADYQVAHFEMSKEVITVHLTRWQR